MFLYIDWYIFNTRLYLQLGLNYFLVSFLKLFLCGTLSHLIVNSLTFGYL